MYGNERVGILEWETWRAEDEGLGGLQKSQFLIVSLLEWKVEDGRLRRLRMSGDRWLGYLEMGKEIMEMR